MFLPKAINKRYGSNFNSNYCSFIESPFKEIYSGALPAQPRSNNVVLRLERKRDEWATGVRCSATGRPFQAVGPATEKARRCRITVRVRGTSNFAWAEERDEIRRCSQWSKKVPGDRMGLVPLCNTEPRQRCGRKCAVCRGASEGHPAYTQRPGQT